MRYSTTQAKLKDADRLSTYFDYTNQSWVVNGHYVTCGHLDYCDCYGRLHAGEPVSPNAELH